MTDTTRIAALTTVLGEELLLAGLGGKEQLSGGFVYDLELLGTRGDIAALELLGTPMTVTIRGQHGERYLHGLVARFEHTGRSRASGRFTEYRAQLRSNLWTLSHSSDSRIFQNLSVPEVLEQVFDAFQITDVEFALSGSYPKCEYLAQYRETAFDFVHRLMEREGIYYFFRHEPERHVLLLADSVAAHEAMPGYEQVGYFAAGRAGRNDGEHLSSWCLTSKVRPGSYAMRDFDFTRPTADLSASMGAPKEHPLAQGALYDYPGGYVETLRGEAYCRARLDAFQVDHQVASGAGSTRGMSAGYLFTLQDFPIDAHNCEHLVLRVVHALSQGGYESGEGGGGGYSCQVDAIDSRIPYRPSRTTRRPIVGGPQTATVVTEGDEEITTDEYGRVKVQFHWDRLGQRDERSSCFVRVAQAWAGQGFGAQFLPRKNQEVIVEFLEGDPDRPIITGSVYNADNMPPYGLPDHRTQSGIKTRTSPGGAPSNCNELRFEDKQGAEELWLGAERDLRASAKNEASYDAGSNMTVSAGEDHTLTVGVDDKVTVTGNQTVTVGGTRTKTIDTEETITVTGPRTTTVSGEETLTLGPRTKTVNGAETHSIHGERTVTIDEGDTHRVTQTYALSAREVSISASDQLTLAVGGTELTMRSDGTVLINGMAIKIEGDGITVNGADVNLSGTRALTACANGDVCLQGLKVQIN